MTEESREGPTPAGGVRSTLYYQDDHGRPAEKAAATKALGVEYDAEGNAIRRTYFDRQPERPA